MTKNEYSQKSLHQIYDMPWISFFQTGTDFFQKFGTAGYIPERVTISNLTYILYISNPCTLSKSKFCVFFCKPVNKNMLQVDNKRLSGVVV